MAVIVSKVLVVFIYIAVGFAAYRLKIFNDDSVQHLTKLIVCITCPPLMISSIGGVELNRSIMFNTVFLLVAAFLLYGLLGLVSLWIAGRLPETERMDANVHSLAMTTSNSGFMGFPISQSVFGPGVFYYMVIQNISLNLYMYTLGIWQLNYKAGKFNSSKSLKDNLKSAFNPILVSAIISVIILFSGIHIPDYCMDIFKTVGDTTIPLSMILVGIQLGASEITSVIKSPAIAITTFLNLVVFPALALGAALLLPVDNMTKLTFALAVCFPSAAIGVALSASEGRNSQLYAEIVASTTLLSMISIPIWIIILSSVFPI